MFRHKMRPTTSICLLKGIFGWYHMWSPFENPSLFCREIWPAHCHFNMLILHAVCYTHSSTDFRISDSISQKNSKHRPLYDTLSDFIFDVHSITVPYLTRSSLSECKIFKYRRINLIIIISVYIRTTSAFSILTGKLIYNTTLVRRLGIVFQRFFPSVYLRHSRVLQ